MADIRNFFINTENEGLRADKYLSEVIEEFSREKLKKLFLEGTVKINGETAKASQKIRADDRISVILPDTSYLEVKAENIPLNIVYEDSDVVVVDKLQGMCVHPAPGNYEGTLVSALLYHIKDLSTINGTVRPGIVHRIDMYTSGLLAAAKNNDAHVFLAQQFAERTILRAYYALVHGVLKSTKGIIDAPVGRNPHDRKSFAVNARNGRKAVTHFELIKQYEDYALVRLKLETGRTHQIRVHMAYIGHPVIGDRVYGKKSRIDERFEGQLLHAYLLGFVHPSSKESMIFESSLPEYFLSMTEK